MTKLHTPPTLSLSTVVTHMQLRIERNFWILGMAFFALGLSLGSCTSFSRVEISKERYVELRLVGESGKAYYGTFSFEKMSPFNQYKSASDSFTDDMNGKVAALSMDLQTRIPGSIVFRKDGVRSYFFKFDTTRVDAPFKVKVYDNGVFKREIDVARDEVMKYVVVNFN